MDLCCSTKLPLPTIPIVVIGDSLANRGVSLLCGHPVVFPMVFAGRPSGGRLVHLGEGFFGPPLPEMAGGWLGV